MRAMTSYNRFRPTTREILARVREVAASRDAVVSDDDVFDDGEYLMVRVVLPGEVSAITKGDYVKSGVAVRVTQDVVSVNPYVLRLVCTNGAVLPVAARATHLERIEVPTVTSSAANFESSVVLNAIEDELDQCTNPDAITDWIAQVRETTQLDGMSILTSRHFRRAMMLFPDFDPFAEIAARFQRDPDPDETAFGLLNAITATARDVRDPHLRWKLEEFGGQFPAWVVRARLELDLPTTALGAFELPRV
jgi:hypothetical protein